MVPVSPGQPGASGGGGADCPELARVRSALARGVGLEEALNDAAAPATGQVGMARLGQRVRADVDGAGPILQPLIETEGVTDVLVGDGRTWIDRGAASNRSPQPPWMSPRCGPWPCAWPPPRTSASTTPAPSSMPPCPTAPDSTRCCLP